MPNPDADAEVVATLADVAVDVERAPVLRGVDFILRAGESVGVVGANGSGKTTLLRVLATLLPPTVGDARVLGARLGTAACFSVRPRIALVGHTSALYPRLTLRENLHFLARLTGRPVWSADNVLELVGLERAADRRAEVCSHGMQRRTELARVLLLEPVLLLFDEAHTGLDSASAGLVEAVVNRVRVRGGASVVVSHEPGRLNHVCDRMVEIVGGRILALPPARVEALA